MKKVAFIFLTSAIYLIGCTAETTDDHGHDHGPNGEHLEEEAHGHDHDENHEQEDFVVEEEKTPEASIPVEKPSVKKEPIVEKHDDHGHDHGDAGHTHEH